MIGRTQDLIFGCQSRRSIARWQQVYAADPTLGRTSVTLVRLTYSDQDREVAGKAMDFSPLTVRARWDAGHRDAALLARHLTDGTIPVGAPGLTIHDLPPG